MAKNQTKRLQPRILTKDQQKLAAVATFTPAYTATNPLYSLASLQAAHAAMTSAQALEVQTTAEAAAARDAANAAEWAFHNKMIEVRWQVSAQYGSESDQLQAIGLKKKSEYKSPGRHMSLLPA